jgi:hypothetical protein
MKPDTAAEIVGRLNPKAHSWDNIPTSKQFITQSDIAAAIGMLPREVDRLFVRVFFAHHEQFIQALEREFLEIVVNTFHMERWVNQPGFITKMIRTAMYENARQSMCLTCNGQKSNINQEGKSEICQVCKGSGYKPMTNYRRATLLGIHHEILKRHKRQQYEKVLEIVRDCQDRSMRSLALKFS